MNIYDARQRIRADVRPLLEERQACLEELQRFRLLAAVLLSVVALLGAGLVLAL